MSLEQSPLGFTRVPAPYALVDQDPLYIFTAVRSGEPLFIQRGYGAASLLLALILILFATTRFLARDKVRAR